MKWNTIEATLNDAGTELTYSFATPWGPPTVALYQLSRRFADLRFELEWEIDAEVEHFFSATIQHGEVVNVTTHEYEVLT